MYIRLDPGKMALMPSTRRSRGSGGAPGARRLITVSCLTALAVVLIGAAQAPADPPVPPHGDGLHLGGGNDHLDNSSHGLYPETTTTPTPAPQADPPAPAPTSSGGSAVAGALAASGNLAGIRNTSSAPAPRPQGTVTVPPQTAPPKPAPVKHHVKPPPPKPVLAPPLALPQLAPAPVSNPRRSTFANRLLSPTQVDLSAKNLGEGGMLALLLIALLYLPVTIFNKSTEKNQETIRSWFARPRAWLLFLFGWIPFRKHPAVTLTIGAVVSATLFAFIEPGFPTEKGALQYLIGMLLGFALVSLVFFTTWHLVIRRLEPDGTGRWEIYPPFIIFAAFLVIMARLAHFIPGVVLGTVAEYEPDKKLSVRTAGIRVAVTYGALIVLGLAAWFAWIPVDHAAHKEGASSLTLILDSALAITFVSGLESVCFGLIPMTFLDGNDLYTWRKGLWAAMWGAALLWFSVVILHPALSTYNELHGGRTIWFALLFSSLMVLAVTTWGYFRVRDARAARAASAGAS